MKNQPIVSVVLGSYNRKTFLPLTIESIRKELATTPHEIIVVDGGSSDGTLEWLMQQKDIITIVQHNRGEWLGKKIKRRSWGYFMNLGFKIAQGTYVCMLSDDCLVIPGAIVNGIAQCNTYESQHHKVGALAFYWRDWSPAQLHFHIGYTLGGKLYVNHGLYLNKALQEVGYCDEETYFFYNGDGDLCLKMWQAGYAIEPAPNSYIEHYPHANVDVRKTNYAQFKEDLAGYLKKWSGIFYDPREHNVGKIEEKHYQDPLNTGFLFNDIYQDQIKQNPKLIKPPSLWHVVRKKLSWKWNALKRRLMQKLR